jgi:thiamine pyrophosphokinase
MQKTLMDEVPDNLKMQVLADSADSVENTTYYKPLTQEELEVKREQYFDNQIKLSGFTEELNDIKSGYKDKMKPLQTENVVLLQEVKTKQAEITGTLYHLANHDTGFMETYNESAELVSTRRLRPNEKQKNVFQISKSA